MAPTAAGVARWMVEQLDASGGVLYQEPTVYAIAATFGDEFTHVNENGNMGIAPAVLREFRRLTGDAVVWSRSELAWRRRHAGDATGRRQTD